MQRKIDFFQMATGIIIFSALSYMMGVRSQMGLINGYKKLSKESVELASEVIHAQYEEGTFIAVMKVTAKDGTRVKVKPKSIVCLAEVPNHSLKCRAEKVF